MSCRPFAVLLYSFILCGVGCVGSRVGLNNVRAKEWPETQRNRAPDVIANGDDSCSQPGSRGHEEMRVRVHDCPGQGPERSKALPKK